MGKIGVVLISHSELIANGLRDLVNEMNDGSVPVIAAGGTGDGRIGTNANIIQEALESLEDSCDHILIYADLGSSLLSAATAIDEISEENEELADKIQVVDAPIVEGALAGVVQACITDDVNEVIEVSMSVKDQHKEI
ncbi:MAG: dihydroxyacetone kinase phosphoryl donor subunit DhaM [Eubacteriales bacterium]|nr:dihydroxyacetone kinase phosphoryl donor subunit DhaM [Eubacteriales bacterium]